MAKHSDRRSDAHSHPGAPAHEHEHDASHPHHHDATELGPSDPYPFVYSRDPFDARRYAPPGTPYEPSSNRVSRGAAAFSIAVICVVLGLGLLVIVLALVGK